MLRKLSNGTIFNDLERPLTQISRSRHELTLNISQMLRDTDIVTSWADAKRFFQMHFDFNPLMGTLKQQGNGPLYDCIAIRWLLHKPLMAGLLHLVQQGGVWTGCGPAQSPLRCTKCNGPPINGQCTNHRIAVCTNYSMWQDTIC